MNPETKIIVKLMVEEILDQGSRNKTFSITTGLMLIELMFRSDRHNMRFHSGMNNEPCPFRNRCVNGVVTEHKFNQACREFGDFQALLTHVYHKVRNINPRIIFVEFTSGKTNNLSDNCTFNVLPNEYLNVYQLLASLRLFNGHEESKARSSKS